MRLPAFNQRMTLGAVLFALVFILYWPTLSNEFVWDAAIIHKDPSLNSLDNMFSGFSTQALAEGKENGKLATVLKYYRPFTKALHVLEHQVFGMEPFGYNLTNVLLHAAVTLLVFTLVASVQGSTTVAFFAALLFLVKPTHTEAVAWAYSDSYLLMSVFALTTLLAFRRNNQLLAYGTFTLALLTQEMGVLLLPILALFAVLVENKTTKRELMSLAPYVLITAIFLGLRRMVVGPLPLPGVEPLAFINTGAYVFAKYLKIFLWPDAPVTVYLKALYSTPNAYVVAGYLLMALAGLAAWLLWRRDRVMLFWFCWFFAWSAVSYNIGQFGEYLMAEKIIYLASVGFCVVIATLAVRAFGGRPRLVYSGLCAVALVYALNTWQRLQYWHDTKAYLVKALEYAPSFSFGWYALAHEYLVQEQYDLALPALEQAAAHKDNFSLALNDIGNIYFMQGRIIQAAEFWKKAVQGDPTNPQPYFNIGMVMQRMNRPKDAMEYYEQYLSHSDQPDPYALQKINNLRQSLNIQATP